VVLPYIVKKVSSDFLLLIGRLSEGVVDWLIFIPTKKVPPTLVLANEEEVILPMFHL